MENKEYVLFSNVGLTDPIKYKDDKIERPDDFSAFDKIYSQKINQIIEENPNLNLLINMGSGTAQMKSSLYYMVADVKVNCKLVQVPTHNQSSNTPKHIIDNYDIIGEIEQNQDNCENYEDRCREIRPDNIRKKIIKSMIKQYIDVYNYEGAYIAALEAGDLIHEKVYTLIKFLKYRIKLEFDKMDELNFKNLLPIEAKYRNKAAHEIISITDKDLKQDKKIGLDSKDVIDIIKDLFEKTYKNKYGQQIKWDSYDEFNQEILKYLDE